MNRIFNTKTIFSSSVVTVLAATGFAWPGVAKESPQPNRKPVNIVIFVADDLGANDIGPYGNRTVRTPHLDRLARESLIFSDAFASSPTCAPSRASLYTGLYPFRNGAHANHTGLGSDVQTFPKYLQPLGYRVALAGKLHVGPMEFYPFELIQGTNVQESGHEGKGVLWADLELNPVDTWLSDISATGEPFVLFVNDHSPHVVWPEEAGYSPAQVDIPSWHVDTEDTRKARARYYTDITKMDRNVGRLLSLLEKYRLDSNTVVIFTADQGPQWAFGKWNLYDYGIRVPLMVRWPGTIESGTGTGALVSLVDLLPTVVEIAGGKAPQAPGLIDGRSFLPILTGTGRKHHDAVFASHTGDGTMNQTPMRMIRTDRYKYILNLAPEVMYHTHMNKANDHDGGREYWGSWVEKSFWNEQAASVLWRYHNRPKEELYDVKADPAESRNLAKNPHYGEIMEQFRKQMATWRQQQGDTETGPYQPTPGANRPPVTPYVF